MQSSECTPVNAIKLIHLNECNQLNTFQWMNSSDWTKMHLSKWTKMNAINRIPCNRYTQLMHSNECTPVNAIQWIYSYTAVNALTSQPSAQICACLLTLVIKIMVYQNIKQEIY